MSEVSSQAPRASIVEVAERDVGQRIDNFLLRCLKGVPRSRIYRMLRSGEVRINGSRSKPADRLNAGDRVRLPPVKLAEREARIASTRSMEQLEQAVLFEDERLMAINKPSGLAVHGGSGMGLGVIEILRQARPHAPMLELAHRLDRSASGCLLIAKDREMLTGIQHLLKHGGTDKHYWILVRGEWRGKQRKVSAPLLRTSGQSARSLVDAAGKEAVSMFRPVRTYVLASLLDANIRTGRMHQIRAHAAHIGWPVAGDDKYGDFEFNRKMRDLGLKRLFLHAHSIRFNLLSRRYELEAPLDADLSAVLERVARA